MSSVNIVKDVLIHDDDAWVFTGNGFSVSNGILTYVSDGSPATASLPGMLIKENHVYELHYNITGTVFAASDTSVVAQIGADGEYSFRGNQVWDGDAPLYQKCGATVASGVELTSVNSTAGDTMTIEPVACLVTQFEYSTNLKSVFVTGDIRVPAGAADLDEDFSNWTSNPTPPTASPEGWTRDPVTDSATRIITNNSNAARLQSGAGENCRIVKSNILTSGKTYLIIYDLTVASGDMLIALGTTVSQLTVLSAGTANSFIGVADGVDFLIFSGFTDVGDTTIDNVKVFEMSAGPIDECPSSGILNGETKYTSTLTTHADGAGGTEAWDLWEDGAGDWVISLTAGSTGTNYWSRTDASQIGDYTPNGNATGTATVTNGPVDLFGSGSIFDAIYTSRLFNRLSNILYK